MDFPNACRPTHGRLLQALAAGRSGGLIGEAGTGCGVGLAWMASLASAETRFVSVELDADRAAGAASLFADVPNVEVVRGDWSRLEEWAPYDLLVLDGGGSGKGGEVAAEPATYLKPNGTVVIDDFTAAESWPPTVDGGDPDEARLYWLLHPDLLATELRVGPTDATIVATRRPAAGA
jgi:predicted O-methyltransferase YrrM